MRSKMQMMSELRKQLRECLVTQTEGGSFTKLARAHGFVDGYMRAMLEGGQATKQELLELVATERARVNGPALRIVDSAAEIAAA
jgi:hypothetical protein